jgi:hypothetical protein
MRKGGREAALFLLRAGNGAESETAAAGLH